MYDLYRKVIDENFIVILFNCYIILQAKDKINTRIRRVSIQQAKHFMINNDRLQIDFNTYSSKLRFI